MKVYQMFVDGKTRGVAMRGVDWAKATVLPIKYYFKSDFDALKFD